jgi:hypothetical protein
VLNRALHSCSPADGFFCVLLMDSFVLSCNPVLDGFGVIDLISML